MNLNGKQIPMGETEPNQHAAAFSGTMQAGQAKKSFTLQYLAGYVKKASGEVEATMLTTYVGFSVVYPETATPAMAAGVAPCEPAAISAAACR